MKREPINSVIKEVDIDKVVGVDKLFEVDSDISRDKESAITSDNKSDVSNDNVSDNRNDNSSDNNSGIISDINSDMLKPKKQPKYTDLHQRRTHYLTKDNVEFIEHLYNKYNQDKSETVNRALMLYKKMLKKSKNNGNI